MSLDLTRCSGLNVTGSVSFSRICSNSNVDLIMMSTRCFSGIYYMSTRHFCLILFYIMLSIADATFLLDPLYHLCCIILQKCVTSYI